MEKIGILTLYHVRNLGACLQAYAMKEIIKSLNKDPVFLKGYDLDFSWRLLKGDIGSFRIKNLIFQIFKEYKFRRFFNQFNELPIKDSMKCQAIIIGSDSVWKAKYDDMYMPSCFFGDIDHSNISAYAPSTGGSYAESDYNTIQLKVLNKLNIVGVRDENTSLFYQQITGRTASIVADPTLLYDWNKFIENIKKISTPKSILKDDYILVYGGFSPEVSFAIRKLGEKKGLKILNVGIFNKCFKNTKAVSPEEFLYYVKHAKFVITSMFHGVMISISLSKEFRYISMDKNRDIKLSTTLKKLGLSNFLIDRNTFISNPRIEEQIDYDDVKKCLDLFRKESLYILKEALEGDKNDFNNN